MFIKVSLVLQSVFFKKIGIHSMQGWTDTTRHVVTRKRSSKRFKHAGKLLERNH